MKRPRSNSVKEEPVEQDATPVALKLGSPLPDILQKLCEDGLLVAAYFSLLPALNIKNCNPHIVVLDFLYRQPDKGASAKIIDMPNYYLDLKNESIKKCIVFTDQTGKEVYTQLPVYADFLVQERLANEIVEPVVAYGIHHPLTLELLAMIHDTLLEHFDKSFHECIQYPHQHYLRNPIPFSTIMEYRRAVHHLNQLDDIKAAIGPPYKGIHLKLFECSKGSVKIHIDVNEDPLPTVHISSQITLATRTPEPTILGEILTRVKDLRQHLIALRIWYVEIAKYNFDNMMSVAWQLEKFGICVWASNGRMYCERVGGAFQLDMTFSHRVRFRDIYSSIGALLIEYGVPNLSPVIPSTDEQ